MICVYANYRKEIDKKLLFKVEGLHYFYREKDKIQPRFGSISPGHNFIPLNLSLLFSCFEFIKENDLYDSKPYMNEFLETEINNLSKNNS